MREALKKERGKSSVKKEKKRLEKKSMGRVANRQTNFQTSDHVESASVVKELLPFNACGRPLCLLRISLSPGPARLATRSSPSFSFLCFSRLLPFEHWPLCGGAAHPAYKNLKVKGPGAGHTTRAVVGREVVEGVRWEGREKGESCVV